VKICKSVSGDAYGKLILLKHLAGIPRVHLYLKKVNIKLLRSSYAAMIGVSPPLMNTIQIHENWLTFKYAGAGRQRDDID